MKIALLGDIALFGNNCLSQNPQLLVKLTALKNILAEHDYVVANLETPLTNSSKMSGSKSAYINSKVQNVEVLKYLGINAVSLANNHTYDFGKVGETDTKKILESNYIEWFGIDDKSLNIDILNQKIALHGYCSFNTNPSYAGFSDIFTKSGLNLLEYEAVHNRMKKSDNEGYINILSSHSGIENVSVPSTDDINFARNLANEFNYIYHGHHPHVIQGIESYNSSVIAYSQGNCIFDDVYDHRTGSLLVEQSFLNSCSFILSVIIDDNEIKKSTIIPFSFYKGVFILNCDRAKAIINERSEALKLNQSDNEFLRKKEISGISDKWAQRRDLKWFVSRLRLSTIFRICNNKVNSTLYVKRYKNLIKRLNE